MIIYSKTLWGLPLLGRAYGSALPRALAPALVAALLTLVLGLCVDEAVMGAWSHPYAYNAFVLLVSFALTFRSNFAYSRWWEAHTSVRTMSSRWVDAAMQIVMFDRHPQRCSDAATAAAAAATHRAFVAEVAHLTSLMHAVACQALRRDPDLDNLAPHSKMLEAPPSDPAQLRTAAGSATAAAAAAAAGGQGGGGSDGERRSFDGGGARPAHLSQQQQQHQDDWRRDDQSSGGGCSPTAAAAAGGRRMAHWAGVVPRGARGTASIVGAANWRDIFMLRGSSDAIRRYNMMQPLPVVGGLPQAELRLLGCSRRVVASRDWQPEDAPLAAAAAAAAAGRLAARDAKQQQQQQVASSDGSISSGWRSVWQNSFLRRPPSPPLGPATAATEIAHRQQLAAAAAADAAGPDATAAAGSADDYVPGAALRALSSRSLPAGGDAAADSSQCGAANGLSAPACALSSSASAGMRAAREAALSRSFTWTKGAADASSSKQQQRSNVLPPPPQQLLFGASTLATSSSFARLSSVLAPRLSAPRTVLVSRNCACCPGHLPYMDRPVLIMAWLHELLLQRQSDGGLHMPAPILARVYACLSEGLGAFEQCRKVADTPFPFPWAQFLLVMLVLFTFTLPLLLLAYVRSVALAVVLAFITVGTYWAVNETSRDIEDPFIYEPNDMPLANTQYHLNELLLSIAVAERPSSSSSGISGMRRSNLYTRAAAAAAAATTSTARATSQPDGRQQPDQQQRRQHHQPTAAAAPAGPLDSVTDSSSSGAGGGLQPLATADAAPPALFASAARWGSSTGTAEVPSDVSMRSPQTAGAGSPDNV